MTFVAKAMFLAIFLPCSLALAWRALRDLWRDVADFGVRDHNAGETCTKCAEPLVSTDYMVNAAAHSGRGNESVKGRDR